MAQAESSNVTGLQEGSDIERLKLKFETWNSDRDDFILWMNSVTAVVRSLKHGAELEDWLDRKLERNLFQAMMVSAIISDDPDFQRKQQVDSIGDPIQTVTKSLFQETPRTIRSVQSLRAHQSLSTGKSAGSYWDLPQGSLTLDRTLYSVLLGLVKGSKRVLIECTEIQSYVQGMVLLQRHTEILRNDRIARAFEGLDTLKYKSNAQEWATLCITRVRELFASRASMTHYALTRIMHSLDGKLKTVQYKIAEDLNALRPEDDVNIYDLIQTYASMIASVGDSTSQVLNVEEDECHYCHETGHHSRDCPKRIKDQESKEPKGKGGKGKQSKWKLKCDFCGRKGHTDATCKFKEAAMKKVNAVSQESEEHQKATNNTSSNECNNIPTITQASLAAYLTQLHKGQAPAQRFVMTPAHAPTTNFTQPIRHQIGRNGERIGEASHPGPTSRHIQQHRPPLVALFMVSVACVLSLCDGMGCGMISLTANDAQYDRYIAVEIDDDAKKIARNANPHAAGAPRIDHSWHSNILNITEQDIADLGQGNIKLLLAGPPCQDFSRLRLITRHKGRKSMRELRPGLQGPHGSLFRNVIQILQWVLKYNPDCEFLIENVVFSDIEDDWNEICSALGEPMVIDSQMYSFTRRNRAYWSNFVRGRDMPGPGPRLDPNTCMMPGRTIVMRELNGGMSVDQIGGTWKGSHDNPYASTAHPIKVLDVRYAVPQHILPEEAEQLHGLRQGCTAGRNVTNKQRLEAIGRGWDVNVTNKILSFSQLSNSRDVGQNEAAQIIIAQMKQSMGYDEIAQCLMLLEPEARSWCLQMLENAHIHSNDVANINDTAYNAQSDTNADTELMETHIKQQAQMAISEAFNALEPEALSNILMTLEPDTRDWYISVLTAQHYGAASNSSVLDSGSSRHLQREVCVTHSDNLTPLAGFDGSTQWTEGNGYIPTYMEDAITGGTFKHDFDNVDLMSNGLVSNILSMGKLIREGWEFHMSDRGKKCYALTPGGAHQVEVDLGSDDILRICHSTRDGKERAPLPTQPEEAAWINTIKKSAGNASSRFIHEVFFHRGDEKLTQTLRVTKGYESARITTGHCDSCAKAKAREFGLSNQHMIQATQTMHDPVFDDDNSLDPADSEPEEDDLEYISPVIGRELGVQKVPRFDLEKLKPFEAVFVDNKDYPCKVRGGASSCLIFIDYKTRTKHKIDVRSKAHNGAAFKRIVAIEGIHKLPYPCRVYTDGCGSMNHVKETAVTLGIDHQFIPPHQQSLNEAEKVCDSIFSEVRAVMEHHKAPGHWFSLMVDMAIYTDLRTATTASRDWMTPFEMTRGRMPYIGNIHRPCTRCYVQVPKSKRRALASQGLHNLRAEPGRFVGFQRPYSSTYAVILDRQSAQQPERLVHSRNVSFDDEDFMMPVMKTFTPRAGSGIGIETKPASSEEADLSSSNTESFAEPAAGESEESVYVPVPNRDEYFDLDDPLNQPWFTHEAPPQPRPRPSYSKMCMVMKERALVSMVMSSFNNTDYTECCKILSALNPRYEDRNQLSYILAAHSQNDMDWNKALAGPDSDKVIQALESEMESLKSTILTEIDPSDIEYSTACELATPGRILLGTKRSGQYKARGVKQGFKEDTEQADGPNFNYYAHVAKFNSIRMSTFRRNRGDRRIALKDVSTAFLQSNKYPDGTVKYVSFKDPLTKTWKHYRQSGPLYGEKSATRRWEDTIAPWYEGIGYVRGDNEPCAFYSEESDALVLLYTDDNFLDADEADIQWTSDQLDNRFKCRDTEWLVPNEELDCLGMQLFQTDRFIGFYLEKYIHKTLEILGLASFTRTCRTPISKDIDGDSTSLTGEKLKLYPTAVGCFGWMSNTCRPDISYAHSRMSQHLSNPTESAWEAVVRCSDYLRGTADMCIAAPIHCENRPLDEFNQSTDTQYAWAFYSDSDFAGNSESQNNRRSQNGFIATLNGAPVLWGSKVSSVAFAHPGIGEAHPDISSGAAEVYAAGNATFEFLHLSYTADEMGIPFPKPLLMQIDNKAALAFSDNSAFKTKLKHIDVRQKWVKTLRNKDIIQTEHVPSTENLADLFTKILDADTFEKLRNRIMHKKSSL